MRVGAPAQIAAIWVAAVVTVGTGVSLRARAQDAPPASRGALIDRRSFQFERRIPPGPSGISWLRLDLAALAHSHVGDVRLVDADGFQVAYLLEEDPEPLRVSLPAPRVIDEPEVGRSVSQQGGRHRTVYALSLPLANLPPCRLVIETPARVFEREVSVLAKSDDPRQRDAGRWRSRAWGSWRHSNPNSPAPALVLDLPGGGADVRLVVDEGDNRPLPIGRAAIETRTWRLRFVRDTPAELWLVYGRKDLDSPRYDLSLRQSMLRSEAAQEVAAEAERPGAAAAPQARATTIFWAAFIASLLAITYLLVRLLRPPAA
jgi:hypothetical protein